MDHVVEFMKLVYEVVAMLNGAFYKTYDQFTETKNFKILPKDFHGLVKKIETSIDDKEELTKNMMQLNENLLRVCEENGAEVEYYDELAKVKV